MVISFVSFTKCVPEDRKLDFSCYAYPHTCWADAHQLLWHSFWGQSPVPLVWLSHTVSGNAQSYAGGKVEPPGRTVDVGGLSRAAHALSRIRFVYPCQGRDTASAAHPTAMFTPSRPCHPVMLPASDTLKCLPKVSPFNASL